MVNQSPVKNFDSSFAQDIVSLLLGTKGGHLDPYLYSDPMYSGDPVRGAILLAEFQKSPSYYLYKGETYLLTELAQKIANIVGKQVTLIDYGPGSSDAFMRKTLPFLQALIEPQGYIAIDLCMSYVESAVENCHKHFQNLPVTYLIKDFYDRELDYGNYDNPVVYFLGNSISNLHHQSCKESTSGLNAIEKNALTIERLGIIHQQLPKGGFLVISQDANQDEASMMKAYASNTGTDFVLNVLHRIKRDLQLIDFDANAFDPLVQWDGDTYCLAIYAVSQKRQAIRIAEQNYVIEPNQKLHISNSHKYPVPFFQQMAKAAGFTPIEFFLDRQDNMAIHVLTS
jgi:L-histidine Nalpha-methyltransferase